MLTRDFIYDSLYNPYYGYFSRQAALLPHRALPVSSTCAPLQPEFDFRAIKNETEFMRVVQQRYMEFEKRFEEARLKRDKNAHKDGPSLQERIDAIVKEEKRTSWGSAEILDLAREKGRLLELQSTNSMSEAEVDAMAAGQVWHTPTQLFSPYYGRALARYLVAEYKLHLFPHHDLILYELGGGAGTLSCDILDYIEEVEPDVYAQTCYVIVEISERLATQQRERLARHIVNGVVEIVHRDFLQWDQHVPEPCFVVALEVLDNLAHDVVRYSTANLAAYQGLVSIDHTGDFHELWEPVSDPLIQRYLRIRSSVRPTLLPPGAPAHLNYLPESMRAILHEHLPLYPNLTPPHYIPTGALQMMDVLKKHFPLHRLVLSDFSSLPDAIEGVNGPVVQTRHKGTMIPVTTYCVLQGFFDIFFPTNFDDLRDVYLRVMASPPADLATDEKPSEAAASTSHNTSGYFTPTYPPPFAQADGYENYALSPARLFSAEVIPPPLLSASREARIVTHAEFLTRYAEVGQTQLRDGTNPLLSWYQNACWFLT
ncbi:hypothetical protein MVES_000597 [Malassezia vespertilionis]|uniref:Protein arginine methyltransferase NDUFAF7 n=2 Tax=Malassezia vespertilionis TaxID=2020962 RepID=A0A2N1JH69_9BASI|nr:hypothetical protein MVES_000597 [Malassezia vespertilionis]